MAQFFLMESVAVKNLAGHNFLESPDGGWGKKAVDTNFSAPSTTHPL